MIGGNHLGILVTHVDKASKFLVAGLAKNKTAKSMNIVTSKLFKNIPQEKLKTFTCDNGKEFSFHEELSETLSASFYFANLYHSWERGLNEHTNGLLRQFFPKGTNFKIVSPEEVEKAVELINNRPRKCLDYRTPLKYSINYFQTLMHFIVELANYMLHMTFNIVSKVLYFARVFNSVSYAFMILERLCF